MRSLFSSDKGECFPISQDMSRVLRSRCFLFVTTWSFHVRRLSKWSPTYLTVSTWGTTVWLMYTGGQCPRRRVNVMCEDLVSLIFSRHFRVQISTWCRWSCRLTEANTRSVWVVKMVVSSAKVLRIVVSDLILPDVVVFIKWIKVNGLQKGLHLVSFVMFLLILILITRI
jgi:hypothetical protein